ncbi:hypothetical protein BDZ89DRAFT_1136885 [Hymenopellis radicata]|nr:hypothetical protein BDZ89DRAFT_1136885 [Hymenopellis radicata]
MRTDGHPQLNCAKQDYDEYKNPRGVRVYTQVLSEDGSLDFGIRKVAGNVGDEHMCADPTMKAFDGLNVSVSARLPGYDMSSWTSAGVIAYRTRTTFDLDLSVGSDVPLAFDFALDNDAPHRVLIFVNEWRFGRSNVVATSATAALVRTQSVS